MKFVRILLISILAVVFFGAAEHAGAQGYCGGLGINATIEINAKLCSRQWNGTYICNNNGRWYCNGSYSCAGGGTGAECYYRSNVGACTMEVSATGGCTNDRCNTGCNISADLRSCSETRSTQTGSCWVNATSTPAPPPATNTPIPGCTPGSCNTSGCDTTPCGQGCGSNGCGTCSSGTLNCPVPTVAPGNPRGYLDVANCVNFGGWTGDPDNINQAIDVHFYTGSTFLGSATANSGSEAAVCSALGGSAAQCGPCDQNPRPPISTHPQCYHRFNFATPSSVKNGNDYVISAFGINISGTSGSNAQLNNFHTINCPLPQGVIQGCRVDEPGTVQSNTSVGRSQTTYVDGVARGPFDWRQFCYTTNQISMPAGGNHPANSTVPAGYEIGYTLCYNNTSCHSPSNVVPGAAVSVVNNDVMSGSGSPFYYADLWWHYCPAMTAPTNVNPPSGTQCSPAGDAASFNYTLSWSPVNGAIRYHYRLDDTSNGWANSCDPSLILPGDSCVDNYSPTSFTRSLNVDRNYSFWVHSSSACNPWGPTGSSGFRFVRRPQLVSNLTATPNSATGNVVLTWGFSGANQYNLYRNGVLIAANATSPYTDPVGIYACGNLLQYRVDAVSTTNPASCQVNSASASTTIACIYSSHFRARGGGAVAGGGALGTNLPSSPTQKYLVDRDAYSNRAGMGFGSSFSGNLTSNNVSLDRWLVDHAGGWTTALTKSENRYATIRERILAQVNSRRYTSDVVTNSQSAFNTSVQDAVNNGAVIDLGGGRQVAVMEVTGNLTINDPASAVPTINTGSNKVLFLVNRRPDGTGGNVNVDAQIRRDAAANGWMMILAEGDINVNRNVGHTDTTNADITDAAYPPHLEGVYYAGGIFRTGGNCSGAIPDRQLRVDGTVIGMTGVSLCRHNLGVNPSEYFWFRPEITLDLYQVGLRKKVTQELVAP